MEPVRSLFPTPCACRPAARGERSCSSDKMSRSIPSLDAVATSLSLDGKMIAFADGTGLSAVSGIDTALDPAWRPE